MLRLAWARITLLVGMAGLLGVMALPMSVAQAAGGGGPVECPPVGPCIVVVVQPGSSGSSAAPGQGDPGGGTTVSMCVYPPGSGNAEPCFDPVLGWLNTSDGCYYRSIPAPPPGSAVFTANGSNPSGLGAYYLQTCMGVVGPRPGAVGPVQLVVWLAAPPVGFGGAVPGPGVLAARAVALLGLAGPQIVLSPPVGSQQMVGLPTWLWTRVGPTTWSTHSATAAVPGESVTATAAATSISWSMGDGNTVVCTNPGTPYSPNYDPHAPSPTCGYTYQTPSSTSGDGAFQLTATTSWRVSWAGAGSTGQLSLLRSSSVPIVVVEAEAVNQ